MPHLHAAWSDRMDRLREVPRSERVVLALVALAFVARVGVSAGIPRSFLSIYCLGTAIAATGVVLLSRRTRWLDGPRLALVACALWLLPSVYGRIGGDGIEYYVQAHTIFFDFDLEFENDYAGLGAAPVPSAAGGFTSRMPVGLPLFWIPPLLLTHLVVTLLSWLGSEIPNDGFSLVYQTSATTATFLYGFVALALMEGALRKAYGRAVAILCVLAIWLATPFYFYTVANPFMSHGASVLAATVFILIWLCAREHDDPSLWLLTGVAGGLMALVRVQDVVLLVVPAIDLLLSSKAGKVRHLSVLTASAAAVGSIQAVMWLGMYGWGFPAVVSGHGKFGAAPDVAGLLFSPRHGLMSWTPLFVASLLGWLLLAPKHRRIAVGFWVAFAASVVINAAQADWWGSDSFGQRRMLGLLPFFAWGLGETLSALSRRPFALLGSSLAVLVMWNLQLAQIYNSEIVDRKDQALYLDDVIASQVDLSYRKLLRYEPWIPRGVWVVLYDNLKGVWLDEGSRSLDGLIDFGDEPASVSLVGAGWFEPETEPEDVARFRRSRTRRSWLTVPIRRPMDYELVIRARGEMDEPQAGARLDVNGSRVGDIELTSGWAEHHVAIPGSALMAGLNRLTFVYEETPRSRDTDFRGRNTVMSVDWLRFEPAGADPKP